MIKLTLLQKRILGRCFDRWRFNTELLEDLCNGIFDSYAPQTIKNTVCDMYQFGYLERRRIGRQYKYKISRKGRELLLHGLEVVKEIHGSSSNDSRQIMLSNFIKR